MINKLCCSQRASRLDTSARLCWDADSAWPASKALLQASKVAYGRPSIVWVLNQFICCRLVFSLMHRKCLLKWVLLELLASYQEASSELLALSTGRKAAQTFYADKTTLVALSNYCTERCPR